MSIVHVRHIGKALERDFRPLIDMSDYTGKPGAQADGAFNSRAQAAYALVVVANADPHSAADAVTDSFDDNGIDAIYYDEDEQTLFLVQSKWHGNGQGSIDQGSMLKFLHGVRDLLDGNFPQFNSKIRSRAGDILSYLEKTNIRLHLLFVHTGVDGLAEVVKRSLREYLAEINDVSSSFASSTTLTQKELHRAVSSDAEGRSVQLEVLLHNWGRCEQPYSAYYGQVDASDIGGWWVEHQQLLFAKNLRKFTGSTDVNESIKNTLINEPTKFWYFNNGITMLCNSLQKKTLGGSKKASGVFVCDGVSIVNGAQTVGCIGEVSLSNPDAVANARVNVRLISLAKCPEEFSTELSRAANTQNRIERRDFAALDPEQERLRKDLHLELGKSYVYKSGDTPGPPSECCTIEEATIALACANQDASLAVQAKREIGKLWEDITKPPYKLLFNGSLTALTMWRLVEILRVVDETLRQGHDARPSRERMVAVHGNRFVLQQIFRQLVVDDLDNPDADFDALKAKAEKLAPEMLALVFKHAEKQFPGSYMNSLFKNASKCAVLAERIAAALTGKHGQAKTAWRRKGKGRRSTA